MKILVDVICFVGFAIFLCGGLGGGLGLVMFLITSNG
jgi:hypothetical protein